MTITLIRGDARQLALADASVDLIVTSPPYFALRSYTDGGEHYTGQVGSEATPAEFVATLVECTREWMRVLKPAGSIWVNLGDKYSTGNSGESGMAKLGEQYRGGGGHSEQKAKRAVARIPRMQSKSLIGLPWRYALACIDDLGLILRAEVIWSKPNGLPESVTDRVRRSHEQWFHFVKQPRYFSAIDEIREAYEQNRHASAQRRNGQKRISPHPSGASSSALRVAYDSGVHGAYENPLGKLPGSVWEIATQPLSVPKELGIDHFAAFPMEWPRRIILGWSPSGICIECGEVRRPITERDAYDAQLLARRNHRTTRADDEVRNVSPSSALRINVTSGETPPSRIIGYACDCPPCPKCDDSRRSWLIPDKPCHACSPTRSAVVLDPFGGTGTTALVASVLGRRGISVDMSADYCRLAQWRTADPKQIERANRPARIKAKPVPSTASEWLAYFGI